MTYEPLPEEEALWRFSIISPLLHRSEDHTLEELLHIMAQKHYVRPDGPELQISAETLRKWLYRYRKCGLPGLQDQSRKDKGTSSVPKDMADKLHALRQEHERWTIKLMLEGLREAGIWNGITPSRSTIYRFCKSHNLQRDPHLSVKTYRSFQFRKFGHLWIADFLHGPRMWQDKKKRKTYLHAIIDDCSRFIVAGRFYTSEKVQPLIFDLMFAVRRFGIPERFYTDNGAAYKSRHLKLVCARLGVQLIHTPAYTPQGRGKIERLFRTVRTQFLNKHYLKDVDKANELFSKWVAEYHHSLHSSLKATPANKRMSVPSACRIVPDVSPIEDLFRMQRRCRVYNNGTIRINGLVFEVPGRRPGARVTVHYMPWDLSVVYYGDDYRPARMLDTHKNALRFHNPISKGAHNG